MQNLILNRDFKLPDDGWYQLAPLGEFSHAAAGVVQVIDGDSCAAMVQAFDRDSRLPNFAGLLIDFDHFSLDGEKRSEAAGWIMGLEQRDTGLFANIRWSDIGKDAVEGGRYRFLSPVWSRADCEELAEGKLRPVRVLNAAVTNDPNLKGMVPLSNRAESGKQKFEMGTGDGSQTNSRQDEQDRQDGTVDLGTGVNGRGDNPASLENYAGTSGGRLMKKVIEALINRLKLSADASEDDVLAAVEKMPTVEDFEALQNSQKDLQETHDALLGDAKSLEEEIVNRHLVDFEAVISEESKAFWTEQLLGNRDAALGALGELAKSKATGVKPDADKSTRRPLHNRQTARPQNRGADGRPSPDADESRAVKIRNRAHELCKTEGIPFSVAFRRAETEIVGA